MAMKLIQYALNWLIRSIAKQTNGTIEGGEFYVILGIRISIHSDCSSCFRIWGDRLRGRRDCQSGVRYLPYPIRDLTDYRTSPINVTG